MCGASLAHHGLLHSCYSMNLSDVDLSPVPTHHLASLVSCVTNVLIIENVSGCDLVNLLTNIKCEELIITRLRLDSKETQALVQAMESGVEKMTLFYTKTYEGVTLDIEALTEYSGQGRCRLLWLNSDTADKYREELTTWAESRNWTHESLKGPTLDDNTNDIYDKYKRPSQ